MKEDNELLELCKQVYEATGWLRVESDNKLTQMASVGTVPLYASDYLLEKLPGFINTRAHSLYMVKKRRSPSQGGDAYHVYYNNYKFNDGINGYEHHKPVLALLQLTLALHKEGLLL